MYGLNVLYKIQILLNWIQKHKAQTVCGSQETCKMYFKK